MIFFQCINKNSPEKHKQKIIKISKNQIFVILTDLMLKIFEKSVDSMSNDENFHKKYQKINFVV